MRPPGSGVRQGKSLIARTFALLSVLLSATVWLPPPPAAAQEEQAQLVADLRLIRQTPVASGRQPFRIRVEATHIDGPRLRDLTISLWIYNPARSRSAYLAGLEDEPPTEPLLVAPFEQRGSLQQGETRTFTLKRRLPELIERGENALYPVKVQLESEGVAVAMLRTMIVFVNERPLVPLNVSVTWVLDAPLPLQPDGAFANDRLERAVAPGGRISTIVSTLEQHPIPTTLVISPVLLEQLERMGNGYRVVRGTEATEVPADAPEAARAGRMLERIREIARSPTTEVVALPYAAPSLPALVEAGLETELRTQILRGRTVVQRALRAPVPIALFRPPRSEVSSESLDIAASLGVETLILDAETLPPPPGLNLSPPATARVDAGFDALAPDPGLTPYLAPSNQPRLRAIQALGELSAIYFEQPSVVRGVALVVGLDDQPNRGFLSTLLGPLADPPAGLRWLQARKASAVISAVPPLELPAGQQRRRIRSGEIVPLSPTLVAGIRDAGARIQQFRTMVGSELALTVRLRDMLLIAESGDLRDQLETALEFVGAVGTTLDGEFDKIQPPSGSAVTLTSQRGVIPITMRNLADYDVKVRVTLLSPRLDFLEGATQEVVLSREALALTFPVRAQATGRFPVRILVDTPGGSRIAESQIVVRSTAYNRVALFVTIGAAVFLALWWGRRFLRRARS